MSKEEEKISVRMIYSARVDKIEGRTITLLTRNTPTDRYEPINYELHEDLNPKDIIVYVGSGLVDIRLVDNKIQGIWNQ